MSVAAATALLARNSANTRSAMRSMSPHLNSWMGTLSASSAMTCPHCSQKIREIACARFSTVLGPGADASHKTHLHVDLQDHRRLATAFNFSAAIITEAAGARSTTPRTQALPRRSFAEHRVEPVQRHLGNFAHSDAPVRRVRAGNQSARLPTFRFTAFTCIGLRQDRAGTQYSAIPTSCSRVENAWVSLQRAPGALVTSRPSNNSGFTWDTEHSKKIAFTEERAFRRMLLRSNRLARARAILCPKPR